MKKLAFFAAAAIFAACTPTPEETAQQLITDYLQKNMNDPKTYEAIEFGKLDSTFTNFQETGEYQELDALYERYIALAKLKQSEKEFKAAMAALDTAEIYANSIKEKEQSYKPTHSGWKMTHSYRGANGLGVVIKCENAFFFNIDLSDVTNVE